MRRQPKSQGTRSEVLIEPEPGPGALRALYERDREVHPYGLADLEEPVWGRSRWYRHGDAAVGVLDLGSGLPVLYAVAARDEAATLDLLADLVPVLPERFVITGPVGLADRLAATHRARWVLPHRKMHLARPDELPPEDGRVEVLGRDDVGDVLALRASDDDASAFFVPELVDSGHFLGIRDRGRLVAAAGTHVLAEAAGVAAIGNVLTHPAHRRRGLARAVVATLARRLDALVPTVGLNVGVTNRAALALYRTIGFEPLITYDEAELVRTRVSARSEEATT